MKLEQQVSNRELSQRLKDLGVKQESQFWWIHSDWFPAEGDPYELQFKEDFPHAGRQSTDIAAFTVAELGEMLPHFIQTQRNVSMTWKVTYSPMVSEPIGTKGDTEADARAKMLIYLIEQGIVKP